MDTIPFLDRDCSALAGLFQIIINDLKNSGPIWEDFLTKASKLQNALKTTLAVFATFLDAFQRIADSATHTRGATKEVGAALTRLSLRQRAIEERVKGLSNALTECLINPLQEKMEEWRKTSYALDKEHTKEYKRTRADIKKRSENAFRLQKKAKKAAKNSELNKVMETTLGDLITRYGVLEEMERASLRHALREERSRYCTFALALKPVLNEEVGLVSELGHLQEVMHQLEKHSADPHILPPASEQVLEDIKRGESRWSWQTPPSSPSSSLGSRKSSMCSISSLNSSSSSSAHSPSHLPRPRSVSQGVRMLTGLSQDSGFTSQDALNKTIQAVSVAFHVQNSGLSERSDGSHTPSPAITAATATWPNLTDPSLHRKSASTTGLPNLSDRPHTISSAYERGKDRLPLTVYTFQEPVGMGGVLACSDSPQIYSQPASPVSYEKMEHPPLPERCASLERPPPIIPDKRPSIRRIQRQQQQLREQQNDCSLLHFSNPSLLPDFNRTAPDMVLPQPIYSNLAELKQGYEYQHEMSEGYILEIAESLGSLPNRHTSRLEDREESKYYTMRPHSLAVFPQSIFPSHDVYSQGYMTSQSGSLRRGVKPPPPPVRRTSSITSTSSLASALICNNNLVGSFSKASLYSSSSLTSSPTSNSRQSSSNEGSVTVSPLQKTDSESSTPVGSTENLPPPPAYLLEDEFPNEDSRDNDSTTPEGVLCVSEPFGHPNPIQDECLQMRTLSVSETIKNLQEIHHQPPSPITYRRTQGLRLSVPNMAATQPLRQEERRVSLENTRSAIITNVNSKSTLSNPILCLVSEAKSPLTKVFPIYSQYSPPHKAGSSPRSHNARLAAVQEGVSSTSTPQDKRIYQTAGSRLPPNALQAEYPYQRTELLEIYANTARKQSGSQEAFIKNLNMVLSQRQRDDSPKVKQKSKLHLNGGPSSSVSGPSAIDRASRVRHWISYKKAVASETTTAALRESLLDQIRRGTTLRRVKFISDRSGPRVR